MFAKEFTATSLITEQFLMVLTFVKYLHLEENAHFLYLYTTDIFTETVMHKTYTHTFGNPLPHPANLKLLGKSLIQKTVIIISTTVQAELLI